MPSKNFFRRLGIGAIELVALATCVLITTPSLAAVQLEKQGEESRLRKIKYLSTADGSNQPAMFYSPVTLLFRRREAVYL